MAVVQRHVTPGGPALNPTFIAVATTSGALDEINYLDPNIVYPNRSFSYVMPGGGTQSFYLNMPRVVSPGLRAELLALGYVS